MKKIRATKVTRTKKDAKRAPKLPAPNIEREGLRAAPNHPGIMGRVITRAEESGRDASDIRAQDFLDEDGLSSDYDD